LLFFKKDTGHFLNPWGANMGYTSSIFSRNEYRSDVEAYKVGALYPLRKNLKLTASYASYGQSDSPKSKTDAKESNIVIVYKPMKNLSLKLFNVQRTSEFDSPATPKTQNQTRLIANYKF
jgi:hypothetical protein